MKIYRVVVRGQFEDLSEPDRAVLVAEAPEHHFLKSAFTAEGTLTYDEQLVAFNTRYEVRDSSGEMTRDAIADGAIERTERMLSGRGLGSKRVRATVTDMASIWD